MRDRRLLRVSVLHSKMGKNKKEIKFDDFKSKIYWVDSTDSKKFKWLCYHFNFSTHKDIDLIVKEINIFVHNTIKVAKQVITNLNDMEPVQNATRKFILVVDINGISMLDYVLEQTGVCLDMEVQ